MFWVTLASWRTEQARACNALSGLTMTPNMVLASVFLGWAALTGFLFWRQVPGVVGADDA